VPYCLLTIEAIASIGVLGLSPPPDLVSGRYGGSDGDRALRSDLARVRLGTLGGVHSHLIESSRAVPGARGCRARFPPYFYDSQLLVSNASQCDKEGALKCTGESHQLRARGGGQRLGRGASCFTGTLLVGYARSDRVIWVVWRGPLFLARGCTQICDEFVTWG